MASNKTMGIVLRGTNFGEADKILTVLTERFGKIKVMAKGVRKIRSHLAGALEPFVLSDLMLHEGKTFQIVAGAAIVNSFPSLHTDLKGISKAFYVGEIADKLVPENQKLPEIFDLLKIVFESLEAEASSLVIRAFELKIMIASGFQPELYSCVHCKAKVKPGNNYWDGVEGGLICEECQRRERHGREISDEAIKLLRFFEKRTFEESTRLVVKSEASKEVETVLGDYLTQVLERELKSKVLLNKFGR